MLSLIEIKVKQKNKKSTRTIINVDYGDALAKYKITELGDQISSINDDAIVDVNFLVYNNISQTWMEMFCYYANEKKLVILT